MIKSNRFVDKEPENEMDYKWTFRWQVAGPSQDPFMLINFENDGTALLFDCGVRVWGKVKTVLKIDHLCISHAHIDHLIGFDHIIRSLLGENKTLNIHGPEGIIRKLHSKLAGYDWDKSAEQELILSINEYHEGYKLNETLACNRQFQRPENPKVDNWNGPIIDENRYSVHAVPVHHGGSPCFSYVLIEKDIARIDKQQLNESGISPGPWVGELLSDFKHQNVIPEHEQIEIDGKPMNRRRLANDLIRIQKGRKIVYITDTVYKTDWLKKMQRTVQKPDLVVCESTFLNADARLASVYSHLTSVQAAKIAKKLQAKKLMLFHISSRYHPNLFQAVQEARTVFPDTDMIQSARKNGRRNTEKKRYFDAGTGFRAHLPGNG
jgi:ribonuclease Z